MKTACLHLKDQTRGSSHLLSVMPPILKGFPRLKRNFELKAADFGERTLAIANLEATLRRRIKLNSEGPTVSACAVRPETLG